MFSVMNAVNLQWVTIDIIFLLIFRILHVYSVDVKPQKEAFTPDYNVYHNLSSLKLTLDQLLRENSGIVKLVDPLKYVSKEDRKQYVLHITNFAKTDKDNSNRLKILFSFGEHSREFLPIESLLYFLKTLFKRWRSSGSPDIDLNKVDIYVITIANPDGRQYVEKVRNYCWRGTSTGVDINRNMDWEFGGQGSSADPSDEEYHGPKAFSEKESQVYRDLTEQVKFDGFLSLHSGIKHIYIPYADSMSKKTGRAPANLKEMTRLAHLLSNSTMYKYQYGPATSLTGYTADGTVFDYMAGKRKIPFSYAIELWGPDKHTGPSCFDLFNPPNERLEVVVSNLYPIYTTFINYLMDWKSGSLNPAVNANKNLDAPDSVRKVGDVEKLFISDGALYDSGRPNEHGEAGSVSLGLLFLCLLVSVTLLVALYTRYPVCRRAFQRRRIVSLRTLGSTLSLNLFKGYT